jgi:hypothetical protein
MKNKLSRQISKKVAVTVAVVSLTLIGIAGSAEAQSLPIGFTCGLSNAYSQNGGVLA